MVIHQPELKLVLKYYILKLSSRGWKDCLLLRTLADLTEYLNLVPSTQTVDLTTTCHPLYSHTHIHT